MSRSYQPGAEGFWAMVDSSAGPDACWLWLGSTFRGYGQRNQGGQHLAHRVAYELVVGPIPDGMTLDHLCWIKHCVNPKHLEPVTLAENIRRAYRLQTSCKSGHPFDEANTYRGSSGRRSCRACHRATEMRRNRRNGMPVAKRLSDEDRARIVAWLAEGLSQNEAARRLGVNSSTVCRQVRRMAA